MVLDDLDYTMGRALKEWMPFEYSPNFLQWVANFYMRKLSAEASS